jgi:hypothetical protein
MISFEFELTLVLNLSFAYIPSVFFILEIAKNLNTGYYEKAQTVNNRMDILKNYIRF